MHFLLFALLALAACSKDDKPKPPAETSFNVSHGLISVDAKHK